MAEQEFCIKLVSAVKKYEWLYNFSLADYSRRDIVDKTWVDISKELNEEVAKCKEKWRNIRTVFMRNLKYPGKTKKGYYLNDKLQFLLPHLKHVTANVSQREPSPITVEQQDLTINDIGTQEQDNAVGNSADETRYTLRNSKHARANISERVPSPPCEYADMKIEYVDTGNDYTDVDTTTIIEPPPLQAITQEPNNKRSNENKGNPPKKKKGLQLSEVDKFIDTYNQQLFNEMENDAKKAFLISLLPDLQSLNDKEMRHFKRRVLALIDEIIDNRKSDSD